MNCYELKMNPFLTCLLTGNTDAVGGQEIWDQIYSEYIGLCENKSASHLLSLLNEIDYMKSKQFIIFKLVELLAEGVYDMRLVAELKSKGCRGKFDPTDEKQYSNDLKAAYSYGKKFNGLIRVKELEIENINKRNGGREVDRKFFEDLAANIEAYCSHPIDFETITVARFVSKWNQYNRYCEVQNAEKNNLIKPYGR